MVKFIVLEHKYYKKIKMKILITGGCGFVGTNLALVLKSKGYKIDSLDNLSRKGSKYNLSLLKRKNKNFKFNIENFEKFKNFQNMI